MTKRSYLVGAAIAAVLTACASAPQSRPDQRALEARADGVVRSMAARDPSLAQLLAEAPGYVVFPEVTEAGFVIGGAQSVGVVYESRSPTGYAELRGASIGVQIGGQSYSQLVVFDSEAALERFRAGNFDLNASVTATALSSGAAARARFEGGVAVFIDDESGLMAGATLGGEQLTYIAK